MAILPTSSDEYHFPSIGIRNRLQVKPGRSRRLRARHLSHNARPAFAFSQCSQQTVVPSFDGVAEATRHPLAPTYGDVPTRCFTDLSTGEIHSPPAFPLGARSFGSPSLQPIAKHPLDADATPGLSVPKPANCWLLLAINLELLPASLYHLVLTEITARCMACETMLGSSDGCFPSSIVFPFETT